MQQRAVASGLLSTLYTTERGHLRIYDRSPVEDHLRAGVVSAAFVRVRHPRLFPGQSLHLDEAGHPALLLGHATLLSPAWTQPPEIAALTLAQICEGLAVLHRERILHLDIHAQAVSTMTVMVGAATSVALVDSELARHLDLPPAPGDFAAPHRAPELASGRVDARSDVYGLGVLLHQLLYGERLIERRDTTPLDRLLGRMLERDPDRRPSSADDVRGELAALGHHVEPVTPRRVAADVRTRLIVLTPEAQEIARAFGQSDNAPIDARWIAATCELGLRDGHVYLTERPLGAETAGSTDDPSEPLVVGDVVRAGELAFVLTTGDPDLLDTARPRHASTTQRRCPRCGHMAAAQYLFCMYCGHDLVQPVAMPPPALPPPPPLPPQPPPRALPRRIQDCRVLDDLEALPGHFAPEQRVGYWQLHDVVAHGGFAEVYRAEHRSTGRQVAIKVLLPQLAQSPYAVERFIAEGRLLDRVRHPNIVQLLYMARAERPFLVLEWIAGPSLAQWRQRGGRADRAMLWALASQVANALATVHAEGAMVRDLQPNNILFADEAAPTFKLIDFGVASEPIHDDPEREHALMGTPLYMAREVLLGNPRPASDLYALGLVLYELASGTNPFAGHHVGDILQRTLTVEPPPLKRRDLPRAFRKLIMGLLDKDPTRRPDANALVDALRGLGAS